MAKSKVKYQGISTLEVLEEARNYNKWIAEELLTHLSTPALEIGSGTGNLTEYFLRKTPLLITDNDSGLIKHLKKKFLNEKAAKIRYLDVVENPPIKLKLSFETVIGVNVLEHIEDDEKALRTIRELLKGKGKLILLVPAKKIAYTKLDSDLGHFRRYEKKEIIEKLTKNGYEIEKIYYFNMVGLISWIIRDKIKKNNVSLKSYHIKLFDSIVPFLRTIESVIKIPVGISLIVIARKV